MYHRAGQPCGTVRGHRSRGGLLQGLVGEQPGRRIGKFGRGPAPQLHGFDEDRRVITELLSDRGDVTDQSSAGQVPPAYFRQGADTCLRAKIGDVGDGEGYDGLTPVTITL